MEPLRGDIKKFTRRLIRQCNKQCRVGHQFATLVLLSQEDLDKGIESVKLEDTEKLIDSSKKCVPESITDITNYCVSRIDGKTHAEKVLLDSLSLLMIKFMACNGFKLPAHIVLYTWITPCSKCAALIEDVFCSDSYLDYIPVTVIYTSNSRAKGESLFDVENARAELIESGIFVEHVPFYSGLPIKHRRSKH